MSHQNEMTDIAMQVTPSAGPRILVVDPRPERRLLTRQMLESWTSATVAGEAGTRAEAVARTEELDVDVVVLEIQMPVEQGLDTIGDIRRSAPGVGIIVCSFREDEQTHLRALSSGADAFLRKPIGSHDMERALQRLRKPTTALQAACAEPDSP